MPNYDYTTTCTDSTGALPDEVVTGTVTAADKGAAFDAAIAESQATQPGYDGYRVEIPDP